MRKSLTFLVIAMLSLPFFSNCSKNNPNTVIPNVYVDVQININEPSSFNLQPIGGYLYHIGGANGLLVYRVSLDEFKCFDRQSTYEPENWCNVDVDSTGFYLNDTCSNSQFSIFDGTVTKGPATIPLKQYQTTFDGTFITITNQ